MCHGIWLRCFVLQAVSGAAAEEHFGGRGMIYAISDLHGDYEKYAAMLKKIQFSEADTLYVLGDVIDMGADGLRILMDMSARPNVFPIIGEHEFRALPLLRHLKGSLSEKTAANFDADTMRAFAEWGKQGGQETVRAFRAMPKDDRAWILEYLEEFVPYEEVTAGGREFVLVHAGLENFSAERPLDDYRLEEMLYTAPDYGRVYFKDRVLVTGHRPTAEIHPDYKGRIFSLNNHLAIDCGAAYGLPLGCVRLDDLAEFYVA